jgi:hypothetical protein
MKPVRIKYYGLFWLTKRTYLLLTLGAGLFALAAMLFFVLVAGDHVPPFRWPWEPAPANQDWFVSNLWTILIVLLIAELVDILLTLKKFSDKEAEQGGEPDEDS